MKRAILASVAALSVGLAMTGTAFAVDISGAGSTFVFPILAKWADTYKTETGSALNYQSIGSGGGITQIEAKTVTFGASDKPLGQEELDTNGLTQFPLIMGGIVPIVNIEGVAGGQLTLDGATLAGIYLGTITAWNDPAIVALNPNVTLPDTAIVVAHRSDGSGTTFNFTDYLDKVSPEWADKVGSDTAVEWPAGIGAKGNEGVASTVGQTNGSIGYVEFAYAEQNHLAYTMMINKDGKSVAPSIESFQAAASNADWKSAPGYAVVITNEPGEASWPIAATTWVMIHKTPEDVAATAEALKFFDWAYSKGDAAATELDYVTLPDTLVDLIHATWASDIVADGKPVFTPAK